MLKLKSSVFCYHRRSPRSIGAILIMRSSTFVLLIAVVAFTGVLCWLMAEPRYLVDKAAAAAHYRRKEDPESWRRTQERLARPRFIANATLSALAAVDLLGIVLVCRAWRRDLNPPLAPRDSP